MAFRGKVALVTGGGSGMGQLACERLARSGALVAALDVNEEGLAQTAASNDRITTFACDVSDWGAVQKTVTEVEEKLGPIDRTISAAAIMPTGLLTEMDVEVIKKIAEIDYFGVVHTVKATLPGMLERRRGDQVIFSSLMGFLPTMYLGGYCAAKSAVASFAEILSHENRATGVRFTLVAPPNVETPLLNQVTSPMKTLHDKRTPDPLTPGEVIDAIEASLEKGQFLCAPGAANASIKARRFIPGLIWKNMHKIEGF
ncbi:MAG TPA: SDR family NAD(P)-dependent oxidoreductase [Nitriliruptorales bacterium]